MPTYPQGFSEEILDEIRRISGRGVLCNKPYSGTQLLLDYGREHVATGDLLVYTSADSVLQIAAHEDIVPPEELWEICAKVRAFMQGKNGVGRIIARPFIGEYPNYIRTANRHDYSLEPPQATLLDALAQQGKDVIGIGKIGDIFAMRGLTSSRRTLSNRDGMEKALAAAAEDFNGLCFINLVDFDASFGHRNDAAGYARALNRFDRWLPRLLQALRPDDLLMITADHGCDPATDSTDHSREYVPLLVYGEKVRPVNLGTSATFACIGQTAADCLGIKFEGTGHSLKEKFMEVQCGC